MLGNTAVRAGGAVETVGGRVVFNTPNLFGNGARGGAATGLGDAPGLGGALHASGAATIFVSGGIIRNNAAARDGGAFWLASAGVLRVDGTILRENRAQGEAAAGNGGGAIYQRRRFGQRASREFAWQHGERRGGFGRARFSTMAGVWKSPTAPWKITPLIVRAAPSKLWAAGSLW